MKIHTHHIDLDHSNNEISNLIDLTPKQHAECHTQLAQYYLSVFKIKNTRGARIRAAVRLTFSLDKKEYLMPLRQPTEGQPLLKPQFDPEWHTLRSPA